MKPAKSSCPILLIMVCMCFFNNLKAQTFIIPHVPDLQQPIDPWWGNTPDNACAPVSAANICVHWDDSIKHTNAVGLNAGQIADSVPSYQGFFMGTNGLGDPTRANPSIYGTTMGTITMDIDTGFMEYVRWDTSNLFYTPKPFSLPTAKKGYDWTIVRDEIIGFPTHMEEIDARRPDIVLFKYWNLDSTGVAIENEMGGDSIHFFLWDTLVSTSLPPNPHEDWYFDEVNNSAGHAVTGVGYLLGWDPDEGGPLPLTDWIICHDNWPSTPVNVAVPWVDSIWIATFKVDPGPDTISPYISCMDTTVYLDNNGQFYLNETYVVDSAWDNNGVEQLFLDDYYVLCPYTDSSKTITATAMDMFGNMAQCTSTVFVIDTISPSAKCTDTTVYLNAEGNVTIDSSYVNNGSTDNCGILSITLSQGSFNCSDVGINPVNVTVTDVNTNSSQCQSQVTVVDTISPAIACTDTTIYLDNTGNFSIDSSFVLDGFNDNCTILSMVLNHSSFNCSNVGSNQVNVTVNDINSNSNQCQSQVTVVDTISPAITCTDTTIYLDNTGNYTIDSTFVLTGFTDNCNVLSTEISKSNFNRDDVGTPQIISLTAYDEFDNNSTCEVTINVLDTIPSTNTNDVYSDFNYGFSLTPNPSDGVVALKSKYPCNKCLLEVYNSNGMLVIKKNISSSGAEIDLSDFTRGIYFLSIIRNKSIVYIDKVIIK